MIETIERVCANLADRAYSARDAAALIGELIEDPGFGLPLVVKPSDKEFSEGRIASRADEKELSHVQLVVADPALLTLASLAAAFGEYASPPRVHPDSPVRVVFRRDSAAVYATCAIIAELGGSGEDLPSRPVLSVTIRPDARD